MSSLSSFLIGGARHALPLVEGVFRKYYAAFTTSTIIQGIKDVSHKAIVFKIGARFTYNPGYDLSGVDAEVARMVEADPVAYRGTKKRNELRARLVRKIRTKETEKREEIMTPPGLAPPPTDATAIQQPFKVAEAIAADFAATAKRYTGVTGEFNNADMSGLVSRLITGIAHYTLTGEITMADLAAGNEIKITAAGNHTTPLAASSTSIWVPRTVDSLMTPNTLAALTAAACAIGSTLVTDIVPVDAANAALVPSADGAELVEGMYQALRIIGGNMEHNGAGSLYAYALTHGVHNIVSVAGMTDEGGYLRSVLRTSFFTPSYGGISISHNKWNGLPRPADLSLRGWTAMVDAIALMTAACVTVSDPCMCVDGRLYPSTFSGVESKVSECGTNSVGDENDSNVLASKIGTAVPAFANNYIRAITRAMNMTALPNGDGAINHLTTSFASPRLRRDRHLQFPSVSPFYWIEPTGVITFDCSDFVAVAAGFGPLATLNKPGTMPLFEQVRVVEELGEFAEINVRWRTCRTSGLAVHLGNHVLDGLAHAKVVGGDAAAWVQLGGASKGVGARMDDGDDLASYLWERSDVGVPAPGEAMYLGAGLALVTRHATMDTAGWVMHNTHFPTVHEVGGAVTINVSTLSPYEAGDIGPSRHATRAYTRALKALDAARVTGGMRTTRGVGRIRKVDVPIGETAAPKEVHIAVQEVAAHDPSGVHSTAQETAGMSKSVVRAQPSPIVYTALPHTVPVRPQTDGHQETTAAQPITQPSVAVAADAAGAQ
jgi:hypothetical protein